MNDSEITSFFRGVAVLVGSAFGCARIPDRIHEIVASRGPRITVSVRDWRIRRMKTPWGAYTPKAGRTCRNSELSKKPPTSLQSAVVEGTPRPMIERTHDEHFRLILDRIISYWRLRLHQLDRANLAAEDMGQIPSSPGGVTR